MLNSVVFEETWPNIKVSAYVDQYAYDPANGALLFMSVAGSEQAVKAISSAIVACKTVSIRKRKSEELVRGHPASRYRIMSAKLPGGALHQITADARFFINSDALSRLVIIPAGAQHHETVYKQILDPLASPVIPVWSQWIYERLLETDRLREMAGTLNVVEVRIDDHVVDELVSEGVRMGIIDFNEQGGSYAGIH
jgi:hypothetical protein